MSKAQMIILVRQSEQSARVLWGDGTYFGMVVGDVLQGRQPDARGAHIAGRGFSWF